MNTADQESLRLWLRLFTTTTLVERRLDSALKREFGSTLPRFDLLAQLERAPDGLRMGELSERILTTGGNVTWLVIECITATLPSVAKYQFLPLSRQLTMHGPAGFAFSRVSIDLF